MVLQVGADPGQVGLQLAHAGVRVLVVTQDVVQVEVEDVGVKAADLHGVLDKVRRKLSDFM